MHRKETTLDPHCLDDLIEQYRQDELDSNARTQLWFVAASLIIAVIVSIL